MNKNTRNIIIGLFIVFMILFVGQTHFQWIQLGDPSNQDYNSYKNTTMIKY